MKYCPECKQTRDLAIRMCPKCSETIPRYKVRMDTTRGMEVVYDRWLSEDLNTADIASRLNTHFDVIVRSASKTKVQS